MSFSKVGCAWQRQLSRTLALRRLPRLTDAKAAPALSPVTAKPAFC